MKRQLPTSIGPLFLSTSAAGVTGVRFSPIPTPTEPHSGKAAGHMEALILQLNEYFLGLRRTFQVPLDLQRGTEFQRRTWAGLQKIPFGQTCSYRDLALSIGARGAFRAVGSANGRNPIAIVIPCHRVVESSGGLGGFAGGVAIKRKLLALEQGLLRSQRPEDLEPRRKVSARDQLL